MNPQAGDGTRTELESLRRKVQNAVRTVSAEVQKVRGKRKAYLVAGSIVTIALSISLSTLTTMAFRLDAEALTQLGRQEVERQLPRSRENMTRFLQAKAPELTSQLIATFVGALPQVRPRIQREQDARARSLTAEFERDLAALMKTSVEANKAELDRNFPGASDVEKIEKLADTVAAQFNQNLTNLLTDLYPKYDSEMRRVEEYLVSIRDKNPSQLTSREKLEKEMIQVLLRLIVREQSDQPGSR